jgi:hypothetical protein
MVLPRFEIDLRLQAHMEDEHDDEYEHDWGGEGLYSRGLRLICVWRLTRKTSTSTTTSTSTIGGVRDGTPEV